METFIAPCFEQNISYIDSPHERVTLSSALEGILLNSLYTPRV
jgi:hypothetical protein